MIEISNLKSKNCDKSYSLGLDVERVKRGLKGHLVENINEYSVRLEEKKNELISQNLKYVRALNLCARNLKPFKKLNLHRKNDKICYEKEITIPRGLFTFPVKNHLRTKNKLKLEFIPFFEDKIYFDDVMDVVGQDFETNYVEIPQTKSERESIKNINFLYYCFSRYIISDEAKANYCVRELIFHFSQILNKKTQILYEGIINFLQNFKKGKEFNYNTFSDLKTYRYAFCNICKKYLCNTHFNQIYGIDDSEENKDKSLGIVRFKTEVQKVSLNKTYFLLNEENISNSIRECKYNNRYSCYKLNNIEYKSYDEFTKAMPPDMQYLIYTIYTRLKTSFSNNISCLISFVIKDLKCYNVKAAIDYMSTNPTIARQNKDSLFTYLIPKIKVDEQKPSTGSFKCQVQERECFPCCHTEVCSKDNCICVKNK